MGDVSINYEDHVEHVEGIMFVYKLNIMGIYHGIIYICLSISWEYHVRWLYLPGSSHDISVWPQGA